MMPNVRTQSFSADATQLLNLAMDIAGLHGYRKALPSHAVLAMLQRQSAGTALLNGLAIRRGSTPDKLKLYVGKTSVKPGDPPAVRCSGYSHKLLLAIRNAKARAACLGTPAVGTEHLVCGLVRYADKRFSFVLSDIGITLAQVEVEVERIMAIT